MNNKGMLNVLWERFINGEEPYKLFQEAVRFKPGNSKEYIITLKEDAIDEKGVILVKPYGVEGYLFAKVWYDNGCKVTPDKDLAIKATQKFIDTLEEGE